MSMQLQSKVLIVVLEKIEPLTVIKNEPPESEIVENGNDDMLDSSDEEESIPDIKEIEIVLHELSEDLLKSETVSENILENNHTESVETEIFVKSENNPFIDTENITQSEDLNETENTSNGNVNRGTSQELIEVQDSNEHFNAFGNQTDKQLVIKIPRLPVELCESTTLAKAKHACKKNKSTHEQNKKRYYCEKCTYTSGKSSDFKTHQLTHKTKADIDDRLFKYRCAKCKYKTYVCSRLKRHKLTHLKAEKIRYFYCYHCSYKSRHKTNISKHIFRHFKNEYVPFHCYICDFTTVKRNLIIEHFKKHPKHHSKCDEIDYKNQFEIPYFYCYHCSYKSERKDTLKVHIFNHFKRGEIPFHCYICDFVTIKRDVIIEHFKKHPKHHSKCDETDYKNQLKIPHFYCHHCSYNCNRKNSLRVHIFSHFKREEIPFHCYICDFVTLERDLIIEHFKKHPKHHSKKNQLETYTKKQISSVDKKKKYRCDKCIYKTYWCNAFKAHKLMHLKPEEIQYIYCYHCSYKTKHKSALRAHIVRHLKNKDVRFHCYMCDFVTRKRDLIIEHFKTHPKHHSKWNKYDETDYKYRLETWNKSSVDKTKKYQCDKCKYKTDWCNAFKAHKLIHLKPEEIQYFYCYHCSYKTKHKSGLRAHIVRHLKNKDVPFHCYLCDFVTRNRDLIIEHFKTHPKHHSKWNKYDETEYKYRLETCNKSCKKFSCKKCSFRTYQHVKRHELTHKTKMGGRVFKYRCDKCKYKTSRPDTLKMHKLIHLKPEETQYFYCYHCSYKSNRKQNLKGHIIRHFKNEEIPFHCYICDFVTLKRKSFKKHLKYNNKCAEAKYRNKLLRFYNIL